MAKKLIQLTLLVVLFGLLAYVMLYDVIEAASQCGSHWFSNCVEERLNENIIH